MEQDVQEKHRSMSTTMLETIAREFTSGIGRPPLSTELFEIVTWALKASHDPLLADIPPANIVMLKPQLRRGTKPHVSQQGDQAPQSAVAELNDNIFAIAGDLLRELITVIKAGDAEMPTIHTLTQLLVMGLHQSNQPLLADVTPTDITGVTVVTHKQRRIRSAPGDIIAIPAKNGEYFMSVLIAKNSFGVAFGFFKGTSNLRPIPTQAYPSPDARPIYSDDRLIAEGRWRIIGHDPALLALFPAEPEIYHRNVPQQRYGPEIGPYGSGETASGKLRHLTRTEAEEIGLLNDDYRQGYLSYQLEEYLNRKL